MQKKLKLRSKGITFLLSLVFSSTSLSATPDNKQADSSNEKGQWSCHTNNEGRWSCSAAQTDVDAEKPDTNIKTASPTEPQTTTAPEQKVEDQPEPQKEQTADNVAETTAPAPVQTTPAPVEKKPEPQIRKAIVSTPTQTEDDRWLCKGDASGNWLCESAPPKTIIQGYEAVAKRPVNKQSTTPSTPLLYTKLDWVKREHLTAEQLRNVPGYCAGAYIEPEYVDKALRTLDPTTQPLLASSLSSETTATGRSTLVGDVIIKQGYRQVKSEKAIIDRETNIVDFEGGTEFREPDILLVGDDSKINIATKEVDINNAEFVAHSTHMRGKAQQLSRDENGIFHVTRGQFTHCQPGSNIWVLSGKKIILNQETGVGIAKHAVLRIKDIPVFYTPYIRFPIDDRRQSGFLFPQLGSSDDGFDMAVPYYFNIAPNYDATLTSRYISDRGAGAEAEFRYLHENNEGIFGGAYLPNDKAFDDEDRWLATVDHQGRLFDKINTLIDYSAVSDDDYFSDLGTDLSVSSQTHLLRIGQASYNSTYWNLTARVRDYQTIDDAITDANKPYESLPQILLNASYPFENGINLGLNNEYVNFDRDNNDLTGLSQAVGQRVRIEPSISWNIENQAAYIKPTIKYKYIHYSLDDLDASFDDSPSISVPVYSLDTGVFFERNTTWGEQKITQTFEPRLFYLNLPEEKGQELIPDFDTSQLTFSYSQLFRDNRFVGGDRVGDANQLSVGATSRIIDETGFERFRFSGGQIFYFEDREVTLSGTQAATDLTSESAYAAEFIYATRSGWRLTGDIEWDPDISQTNESSVNLRYHGDNRHIFNLGYRVRKDRSRIEQTDISLIWPLSDQWAMFGRWNQDLINNRIVEALAGVEYQNCCLSIRFAGRRYINDTDTSNTDVSERDSFLIQLQLKGLSGIGESLEGILSDSIPSYQEQTN